MSKLTFKDRRKTPVRAFVSSFEAAIHEFTAEFLKSSAFQHALSKGEERERPVQDFLLKHLPGAFDICKGEAVDIDGRQSPQLDLMVFNKFRNFAFYSGQASILPAEALLVSIEVKSTLSSSELSSILRAAERLHRLKPFRKPLSPRRTKGESADDHARFFHCVFAYSSDLSEDKWLEKEHQRLSAAALESKIPLELVSRVYVANRGLINTSNHTGVAEQRDDGTALMQFYMHILNFLSRENDRRKPVPYIEYAGRMGRGWKSLKQANKP
ncbi:MAG: DUF6602 domain-containing protein [Candidatus Sulfotelmatobacter sp.]